MRYLPALIAIVGVVAAACGGAATTGGRAASDQGRRIDLEMKTGFVYSAKELGLRAGEKVTLALRNSDAVEHEFMAGRDAEIGRGFKHDLFDGVDHEIVPTPASDHGMGHGAEKVGVRVQPGRTATLTFVVPAEPGTYEFACFVAGHFEAGMKGTLTIQ